MYASLQNFKKWQLIDRNIILSAWGGVGAGVGGAGVTDFLGR